MMSEAGARLIEELMRFKPDGLTANGWAVSAGVSRTIWADLRRHGNPSRRTLERLLAAVGSSLAEFEALRVGEAPLRRPIGNALADRDHGWRGAALASIPVLDTSLAGAWGERGSQIEVYLIDRAKVEGQVDRPTALAGDRGAYAVTVAGQSMWPRFRSGRQLLVSPAAAVEVGADVLVELKGDRLLIGELVGRSEAGIELRQFNPDATFAVDAGEIEAIHKVMGEAI
jgi:SOS-response transcriptional repressor LexA